MAISSHTPDIGVHDAKPDERIFDASAYLFGPMGGRLAPLALDNMLRRMDAAAADKAGRKGVEVDISAKRISKAWFTAFVRSFAVNPD